MHVFLWNQPAGGSHRVLEGLCRREYWHRGGLDLQFLARARVAAHAALSSAPLERPEALQADSLSVCSQQENYRAAIGVRKVKSYHSRAA